MNQTITINISGIVFHIEMDAYETLSSYLENIKSFFKDEEEKIEITKDVEARIAEIFNEKISDSNQVIILLDVNEIMSIMGRPEDFAGEDFEEETASFEHKETKKEYKTGKQFFRDPDNQILGGVSAGISAYFGIDPIWLRLLFIAGVIFGGSGFLIYIILWIIIPKANSSADKLKMRGESVNIENLGKTFKEEASKVGKEFNNQKVRDIGNKAEDFASEVFERFGKTVRIIFQVIGRVFGLILMLVGIVWFFSLLGISIGSDMIGSIILEENINMTLGEATTLFFSSDSQQTIVYLSIFLLLGIPFLSLIYVGSKLLFKYTTSYKYGLMLFMFWIIGIIGSIYSGLTIASEFRNPEQLIETTTLSNTNDLITLKLIDTDTRLKNKEGFNLYGDSIAFENVEMTIFKSTSDSLIIDVVKKARGVKRDVAYQRASGIQYQFNADSNTILFSPNISFPVNDKIRAQEVRVEVYLPVGKSVYLDQSLEDIIYDIKNVTNTYDRQMLGHIWTMSADGLYSDSFIKDSKWKKKRKKKKFSKNIKISVETENE